VLSITVKFLSFLIALPVLACECSEAPRSLLQGVAESDVVVTGTVRTGLVMKTGAEGGQQSRVDRFLIEADRVWKGPSQRWFVADVTGPGDCSFPGFQVGQSFLLFGRYRTGTQALFVNQCLPNVALRGGEDLSVLGAYQTPPLSRQPMLSIRLSDPVTVKRGSRVWTVAAVAIISAAIGLITGLTAKLRVKW
jgi:hypothetical protein